MRGWRTYSTSVDVGRRQRAEGAVVAYPEARGAHHCGQRAVERATELAKPYEMDEGWGGGIDLVAKPGTDWKNIISQ